MGEPVGAEYIAGDDCLICYGIGKTFGNAPTPKYLALYLSGLEPPFQGASHKWVATQQPGSPCVWTFQDGDFFGYFRFTNEDSYLYLEILPEGFPSIYYYGPFCSYNYSV